MNELKRHPLVGEALEARLARSIVACLDDRADNLGADISTRLRFARERALEAAHARRTASSTPGLGATASGAALLGSGWWLRLASVVPLVALVGGLLLIQDWQTKAQISVAADVDTALLGDDLPLNAYRDAGFSEFLKTPPHE